MTDIDHLGDLGINVIIVMSVHVGYVGALMSSEGILDVNG
jgi:hypothetical protein